MHRGQAGDHAAVALVGDQHHAAGLGHGEVAAADAHARGQEFLAQQPSRHGGQPGDVVGRQRLAGQLGEHLGDLLAGLVDRRRDDVIGRVAGQLDDPLAQVRLHRLHAGRLQRLVEVDLLGGHGLALGCQGDAVCRGDLCYDAAGRRAVGRPVDVRASRRGVALEGLQVLGQLGQRGRAEWP